MNINSSITSATAYIIITTAVIITIDDVFVNITNIPANKDIIDNVVLAVLVKWVRTTEGGGETLLPGWGDKAGSEPCISL